MTTEWTPEQDSALRETHARGGSITDAMNATGMNRRQVWQRTRLFGLTPNNYRPEKTIEAAQKALAERRANLADQALADCEGLRERIWDQYEMVVNGPNGPERITLDIPDAKAVREFAGAIKDLARVHEDLERIGKMRSADVQKSNINVLFDNLAVVIREQQSK